MTDVRPIPLYDCWQASLRHVWGDVLRATKDVLRSGILLGGPCVVELERRLAERHHVAHAIVVSSGTDALALALRAALLPKDGAAWTPAFGCPATVAAIHLAGGFARFVDVDDRTAHAGPSDYEARLRYGADPPYAVVPVHLWGRRADVDGVAAWAESTGKRWGRPIVVIEDAAQGFGLPRLAARSTAACLSFYPTKPLGGIGDGGAILTNDADVASRARALRDYGRVDGWNIPAWGWNARMGEVSAAALTVIEHWADRAWSARSIVAAEYRDAMRGLDAVSCLPIDGTPTTDHLFPIRIPAHQRDYVRARMGSEGITTGIHYRPALPDIAANQDVATRLGGPLDCRSARAWAAEEVSLPIFPGITRWDVERVVASLRGALEAA